MSEEIEQRAADTAPQDPGKPPRTYLVWSALAAAVLFLPLGLVALFFSIRSEVLQGRGDFVRARRASRVALVMIIVTVLVGLVVYLFVIGGLLALGAFSGG